MRQGYGKMTFGAEKTYEGSWLNDMQHGQGKETEGVYVREGSFVNGRKEGEFTEYDRANPSKTHTVRYEYGLRQG